MEVIKWTVSVFLLHASLFLCVCIIKVPLYFRDEMKHFPKRASQQSADVGSERASSAAVPLTASEQNAGDLSVLLDALDRNLAKQGVIVQPKGLCAACSKPVVGRVSNIKVECFYLVLYRVVSDNE